jgi:hypothetical protein
MEFLSFTQGQIRAKLALTQHVICGLHMKRIFVVATFAVGLRCAFAQGITEFSPTLLANTHPWGERVFQTQETTEFVVQLRGNSDFLGEGTFQLTGTTLSYNVRTYPGFNLAAIHGPAQPGMDAPKIFDLDAACHRYQVLVVTVVGISGALV